MTLVEGIGQARARARCPSTSGARARARRAHAPAAQLEVDDIGSSTRRTSTRPRARPGSDSRVDLGTTSAAKRRWRRCGTCFGFLYAKSTVLIGEWGGPLKDDADRSWQHEASTTSSTATTSARVRRLAPQPKQRRRGRHPPRRLDDAAQGEDRAALKPLRSTQIGPLLRGRPLRLRRLGQDARARHERRQLRRIRREAAACRRRSGATASPSAPTAAGVVRLPPCVTVGGRNPFAECRLPFQYNGKLLHTCARGCGRWRAPCPTDISEAGEYNDYRRSGVCGPRLPDARRRRGAEQRPLRRRQAPLQRALRTAARAAALAAALPRTRGSSG